MEEKIGFIGVGTMGKPMALNLMKAGYRLMAYDINPKPLEELKGKGISIGQSNKDVAHQSDIIITMLPNSDDVEKAILGENGVIEGAKSNSIVIDMSTIDPSVSRKIAKVLSEKKIKVLDAPVSGAQMGAEAGTLTIMVGGDEDIFHQCSDIFKSMGKNIFYCGSNGSGGIVKIVNNLMAATISTVSTEALALGVKAGVKLKTLYDVISVSSGQSWVMQVQLPAKAFKGDFEPGFMAQLARKDLGLAMNLGKEEGVPLLLGGLAYQIHSHIVASGLGKKDASIQVKMIEDLLNIKLRF
jgi:3-hydroxyisobutyrate dehydrogenase